MSTPCIPVNFSDNFIADWLGDLLGRPENYLYLLSNEIFLDQSSQKNICSNLENRIANDFVVDLTEILFWMVSYCTRSMNERSGGHQYRRV